MNPEQDEISRNRLINKVKRLETKNANLLSTKPLLKIVNRHHINKKLIRTLNRNYNKSSEFTKNDLDKFLELNKLSPSDLKKVAKHRKITNYGELLRNDLFYALLRPEKEPQEHSYLNMQTIQQEANYKKELIT